MTTKNEKQLYDIEQAELKIRSLKRAIEIMNVQIRSYTQGVKDTTLKINKLEKKLEKLKND